MEMSSSLETVVVPQLSVPVLPIMLAAYELVKDLYRLVN